MKLKNIFITAISAALMFVACEPKAQFGFDEIKVSSSYVVIPEAGGSKTIELTAKADWSIKIDDATKDKEGKSWLSVTPDSGKAGEKITITIAAEATSATRETIVYLNSGKLSQRITVSQVCKVEVKPISVKEAIDIIKSGQTPNKFVEGVIVRIQEISPSYGNATYFIADSPSDTETIQIYRGLYTNGDKFTKGDELSVGDKVVVYGKIMLYGTTYEMDANNYIYSLTKSNIKVLSEAVTIPLEGAEFDVELENKGTGLQVSIPEADKTWLSVVGINVDKTTFVTFLAYENELGDRSTTITFTTNNGKDAATIQVNQKGAILEKTAVEINAGKEGTIYRITGIVKNMAMDKEDPTIPSKYGNYYIADFSGEVYVYGTLDADGKDKNFASLGIEEYDIVTVEGPLTIFNDQAQLKNVKVTNHKHVKYVTIAEFLTKETSKDVYYMFSGNVANIAKDKNDDTKYNAYGNFDLVDGDSSVYVYGLLPGWGGPKGKFIELGINEGDNVAIIATKDYFASKEQHQAANAFLVNHIAASQDGDDEPGEDEITPVAGTVTLTFPDDNKDNNAVGAYDKSWTAKLGDATFDIFGFNNNNWNNWTYIKCGRKNDDSVATITNTIPFSKITKVVVTVDKDVKAEAINKVVLNIYSDKAHTTAVASEIAVDGGTFTKGDMTFNVPADKQAVGYYYELVFDTVKSGSNGPIQISKLEYVAE